MSENLRGGFFLTHTVYTAMMCSSLTNATNYMSLVLLGFSVKADTSSTGSLSGVKLPPSAEQDRRWLVNCSLNCSFGYEHFITVFSYDKIQFFVELFK